jgi:RNA ligase (TIGR02306 family)
MSSLSSPSLAVIESVINHPQADRLDIVTVEGCPAIVGRDQFKVGDPCVFIPFDSILPKEGEGLPAPLLGKRIKPMRLRGIFSMALVLENIWNFAEGDDIAAALNIAKWEPGAEAVKDSNAGPPPPGVSVAKYDLDSLRKLHWLLNEGEEVVITEKIHGANARFVSVDGQLYIGSRSQWLRPEAADIWGRVAQDYDLARILEFCPGQVIFGEVYGQVQDLKYGAAKDQLFFRVFDIYDSKTGEFWDYPELTGFCRETGLLPAPVLHLGPWEGFDAHKHLAEGQSTLADHVREGFVVKPTAERVDPRYGRIAFKLHGEGYLLRKEK